MRREIETMLKAMLMMSRKLGIGVVLIVGVVGVEGFHPPIFLGTEFLIEGISCVVGFDLCGCHLWAGDHGAPIGSLWPIVGRGWPPIVGVGSATVEG